MSEAAYEPPNCPMCGDPYDGIVTKPFRHQVECRHCGEGFEIEGDSALQLPTYRRPFWSDQYRVGTENPDSSDIPVGLGTAMTVIVAVFTVAVMAFAVVSTIVAR